MIRSCVWEELQGIRTGLATDRFGWVYRDQRSGSRHWNRPGPTEVVGQLAAAAGVAVLSPRLHTHSTVTAVSVLPPILQIDTRKNGRLQHRFLNLEPQFPIHGSILF